MLLIHCLLSIILILANLTAISYAEIVLDGSLGHHGTLPGPNYLIEADLGQQRGENLFHSFQTFNLLNSESATFSGPAGIHNIITRVTGGSPSHIDGLLRSTIANADLYFLNPAGVIFGPYAKLDIPASLYVSTADYLKLEDGGRFDVSQPENSLLTIAPPSAFGFLEAPIGKIKVNESGLLINANKIPVKNDTLAFISGDIEIQDGIINSFDSKLHLVSVASEGEILLNSAGLLVGGFAKFGTITVTDSGKINLLRIVGNLDTSGYGGGEIFIRAGRLLLNNGYLFSDTYGPFYGQGINIQVIDELILENGSRITTQTLPVSPQPIGNAGDIHISARQIRLTDGSQIHSSTQTNGNAGNITVFSEDLYLASSQSLILNNKPDIMNSGILSNALSTGSGGQIQITATDLKLDNGGEIRADTRGLGDAGDVSISAHRLTLFSGAQVDTSAGREYSQAQGKSGSLNIIADRYMVIHGSRATDRSSALLANRFTQGEDSDITINTPVLAIADGGIIEASGRVKLNTDIDLIDNFTVLPRQHFDATELLNNRCNTSSLQSLSHFSIINRDTLPQGPEDLKTHFIFDEMD